MSGRAITFDFHNTLADCPEWFELEVRHLPSAFLRWWSAEVGRVISPAQLAEADDQYRQLRREIMDHGNELTAEACLEAVFETMGLSVPVSDISTGVAFLMRQVLPGASPIPGAVETVHALHRHGVPLGVVSSAVYHPFLEWTLENFGIRGAFDEIITSASARFYKSRPEIYLHAADLLNAAPANMVHIGDSLRFDVGGAQSAGMGAIWLQHDPAPKPIAGIVPDLTLETLHDSAPGILSVLDARAAASAGEAPRV